MEAKIEYSKAFIWKDKNKYFVILVGVMQFCLLYTYKKQMTHAII